MIKIYRLVIREPFCYVCPHRRMDGKLLGIELMLMWFAIYISLSKEDTYGAF